MDHPSGPLLGSFKIPGYISSLPDLSSISKRKRSGKKCSRNKHGCFCCRKRKIKCDSLKPSCGACQKSSYLCVWPQGNESLSHKSNFKLVKLSGKDKNHVKTNIISCEPFFEEVESPDDNLERLSYMYSPFSSSVKLEIIYGIPFVLPVSHDNRYENLDSDKLNLFLLRSNETTELGQIEQISTPSSDNGSGVPLDDEILSQDSVSNKVVFKQKHFNEINQKEVIEDALYRRYLSELVPSLSLSGYATWFPGVKLTKEDAFLYSAFRNGFMVSVSPQITHVDLQPSSVFLPVGIHNPILRSLFFACGASFLCQSSIYNESVAELAVSKCDKAIMNIQNFIEVNPIAGNEEWLLLFLLLFCVKQRFVFEGSKSQTLNIISALETVRFWLISKQNKTNSENDYGIIDSMEHLEDEMIDSTELNNTIIGKTKDNYSENVNLDYDEHFGNSDLESIRVFNKLINKVKSTVSKRSLPTTQSSRNPVLCVTNIELDVLSPLVEKSKNVKIHAYERTIVESFIYNYSSILFTCERSLIPYLTSPFEIFEDLKPFLLRPLYNCAVPWMNNPVVGAALPAIELQAKINWLSLHYPLSIENRRLALIIRKAAKYYTYPILPTGIRSREPESVQRKLMESCYAADIIAKSVFILATKLLNPETPAYDSEIQEAVEAVHKDLQKLSLHCQVAAIISWAFAIVGSAMILDQHREYFSWRIRGFKDALNKKSILTVLDFSNAAWGTDETRGPGLDILLDPEYINLLNM